MKLIDADKLEDELIDSVYDNSSALHILWEQPTVCDIEQIRAEIEELDRYYDNDYFTGNKDPMFKCNEVLQIINKYIKGE